MPHGQNTDRDPSTHTGKSATKISPRSLEERVDAGVDAAASGTKKLARQTLKAGRGIANRFQGQNGQQREVEVGPPTNPHYNYQPITGSGDPRRQSQGQGEDLTANGNDRKRQPTPVQLRLPLAPPSGALKAQRMTGPTTSSNPDTEPLVRITGLSRQQAQAERTEQNGSLPPSSRSAQTVAAAAIRASHAGDGDEDSFGALEVAARKSLASTPHTRSTASAETELQQKIRERRERADLTKADEEADARSKRRAQDTQTPATMAVADAAPPSAESASIDRASSSQREHEATRQASSAAAIPSGASNSSASHDADSQTRDGSAPPPPPLPSSDDTRTRTAQTAAAAPAASATAKPVESAQPAKRSAAGKPSDQGAAGKSKTGAVNFMDELQAKMAASQAARRAQATADADASSPAALTDSETGTTSPRSSQRQYDIGNAKLGGKTDATTTPSTQQAPASTDSTSGQLPGADVATQSATHTESADQAGLPSATAIATDTQGDDAATPLYSRGNQAGSAAQFAGTSDDSGVGNSATSRQTAQSDSVLGGASTQAALFGDSATNRTKGDSSFGPGATTINSGAAPSSVQRPFARRSRRPHGEAGNRYTETGAAPAFGFPAPDSSSTNRAAPFATGFSLPTLATPPSSGTPDSAEDNRFAFGNWGEALLASPTLSVGDSTASQASLPTAIPVKLGGDSGTSGDGSFGHNAAGNFGSTAPSVTPSTTTFNFGSANDNHTMAIASRRLQAISNALKGNLNTEIDDAHTHINTLIREIYGIQTVQNPQGHLHIPQGPVQLGNDKLNELRRLPGQLAHLSATKLTIWQKAVETTEVALDDIQNSLKSISSDNLQAEAQQKLGKTIQALQTTDALKQAINSVSSRINELTQAHQQVTGQYIDAFGNNIQAPAGRQQLTHTSHSQHGDVDFFETQTRFDLYDNKGDSEANKEPYITAAINMVAQMHRSWQIDPREKFKIEGKPEFVKVILLTALQHHMSLANLVWDEKKVPRNTLDNHQELMQKISEQLHQSHLSNTKVPLRSPRLDTAELNLSHEVLKDAPNKRQNWAAFFQSEQEYRKDPTAYATNSGKSVLPPMVQQPHGSCAAEAGPAFGSNTHTSGKVC